MIQNFEQTLRQKPIFWFLTVYILILYLPGVIFFLFDIQLDHYQAPTKSIYNKLNTLNFVGVNVFLFGFLIGNILNKITPYLRIRQKTFSTAKSYWLVVLGILGLYGAVGGFQMLFSLGGIVSGGDFRNFSYTDVSAIYVMLLEVLRKIILPFSLSYFWFRKEKQKFYLSALLMVVSGLATLDRFPFLILASFFIYQYFFFSRSRLKMILISVLSIFFLAFLGSLLTYLQHNMLDVDFKTIALSGLDFIVNRVFSLPTVAGIEIGFYLSYDNSPFMLQYSRLSVLWGNEYVRLGGYDAYKVAPVGAIADIYRNFHMFGVLFCAILLGWWLMWLNRNSSKSELNAFVSGFLAFNLGTYLSFGVFFSMGVFLLIIFMTFTQYILFKLE